VSSSVTKGRVHRRRARSTRAVRGSRRGLLVLGRDRRAAPGLAVKLLRVLEDEKIRRVGDTRDLKVDVRIITGATPRFDRRNQGRALSRGLFYRLNVLPIRCALRDRRDDIPCSSILRRRVTTCASVRRSAGSIPNRAGYSSSTVAGNVARARKYHRACHGAAEGDQIGRSGFARSAREARDPVQMQLSSGELSVKRPCASSRKS